MSTAADECQTQYQTYTFLYAPVSGLLVRRAILHNDADLVTCIDLATAVLNRYLDHLTIAPVHKANPISDLNHSGHIYILCA